MVENSIVKFDERELEFNLLCGILDEQGIVHKPCKIRSMSGNLRKKVSQAEYRTDAYKLMSAVLEYCIKEIDGKPFDIQKSSGMLMADADFLLLKIRQHSLGDSIQMKIQCPGCSIKYLAELLVSDIECYPLDEKEFNIEEADGKLRRVFKVKTEHWDCRVRYPERDDQRLILTKVKQNPEEALDMLYARILIEVNGKKIGPEESHQLLKDLDKMDTIFKDELTSELNERFPGVETTHYSTCSECGNKSPMELGGADFLFGKSRTEQRKTLKIG